MSDTEFHFLKIDDKKVSSKWYFFCKWVHSWCTIMNLVKKFDHQKYDVMPEGKNTFIWKCMYTSQRHNVIKITKGEAKEGIHIWFNNLLLRCFNWTPRNYPLLLRCVMMEVSDKKLGEDSRALLNPMNSPWKYFECVKQYIIVIYLNAVINFHKIPVCLICKV